MTIARPLPDWLLERARGDPGDKRYRTGTHRTVDPEETLRRTRPQMADMGITRIANVTGLDRIGIPVVMVCRPNSRSLAVTQGKGLTLAAAKASGLMEAVETYHAERVTLPLRLACETELGETPPVIDVAGLPRAERGDPGEHRRTLWLEGFDLLSESARWLPYESVHTDYTLPLPPRREELLMSTNGLASGNSVLEALSHALCEVIERDATTLWRDLDRDGLGRRRLDLDTVDDAACRGVAARLQEVGFAVAVWDTTSDFGVPAFYALIKDELQPGAHSGTGAGCHPCRAIALLRALLEAVQVRTTYISGARDDLSHEEFQPAVLRAHHDSEQRLLDASSPQADFGAIPDHVYDTFAEDVSFLLRRLRDGGLTQAVMVDLSPAAPGTAVIRVVVPGLAYPEGERGRPRRRTRTAAVR